MELTTHPRKLNDLDIAIPGLSAVWRSIKGQIATKARTPKTLTVTDKARRIMLNDGWLGRRYGLNLSTMTLSDEVLRVSSGEWAVHAGSNNDQAIETVPNGFAVIDCEWNDNYGSFLMTIQVSPGAIPAALPVVS